MSIDPAPHSRHSCGAIKLTAKYEQYAWQCSVFTPKYVFGSRTAKSQPIWINFCTHLLLNRIHLWADFDRD